MKQPEHSDPDTTLAAKLDWFNAFTQEHCGRTFDPILIAKWVGDLDAGRPYESRHADWHRPTVFAAPGAQPPNVDSLLVDKYSDLVNLGAELRSLQNDGEEPEAGHLAQIHIGRQEVLLGLLENYLEVGAVDVAMDLPGVLHLLLARRFPLPLSDRVRQLIYDKVPETYDEAISLLAISSEGLQLLLMLIAGIGTQAVGFSDTPVSDAQLRDPEHAKGFSNLVDGIVRSMGEAAEEGLRPETIAGALLTLAADLPDIADETRLSLAGLFLWSLKSLLEPFSAAQGLPDFCEDPAAREMSKSLRVSADSARLFLRSMRSKRLS